MGPSHVVCLKGFGDFTAGIFAFLSGNGFADRITRNRKPYGIKCVIVIDKGVFNAPKREVPPFFGLCHSSASNCTVGHR